MRSRAFSIVSIVLVLWTAAALHAPAQEQVIYNFVSKATTGSGPSGPMAMDSEGNFYGTVAGGVFELSPPAEAGGDWTEQLILDAQDMPSPPVPSYGVIFDSKGNLYGIQTGGDVIEVSPPGTAGGAWTSQIIYTFEESNAATLCGTPTSYLTFDSKGNLYGTCVTGGANSEGGVYEISPPTGGGTTWTEQLLHSFANNGVDGYAPAASAGVVFDSKGNLYGTTVYGGTNNVGTVYELSPPASGTEWKENILYSFSLANADAYNPEGAVVFDAQGNLYSTSNGGGNPGLGTVFELSPPATTGGKWTETIVYNFRGKDTDGSSPIFGLTWDSKGDLWGTSFHGGPYSVNDTANTDGAIFELTPAGGGTWHENVAYFFGTNLNDVYDTKSPLLIDSKGNLYGSAGGGANVCNSFGCGGIYDYTPQAVTPAAATPVITPGSGTYHAAQKVTITDATEGATIYYTLGGSMPTTSSTKYSGPIEIAHGNTIEAIATASGYSESDVAIATYTIVAETPAATPVISAKAGVYAAPFAITISDSTSGADIYYTTNGTTPMTSSTKYTGAFKVTEDETVKAIATAANFTASAIASVTYSVKAATPVISVKAGTYAKAQSVKITDTTAGTTIYYTTNGVTPTTASKKYTGAISVSQNETVKAIAVSSHYAESTLAEAIYSIETAPPTISPDGGTFSKSQTVTLKDATAGAVIYYTTNGKTPTQTSAEKYAKPFTVSSKTNVKAIAVTRVNASSTVSSAAFNIE